jgi:hypothetical protein
MKNTLFIVHAKVLANVHELLEGKSDYLHIFVIYSFSFSLYIL